MFNQYQQNKQPPLIWNPWIQKKNTMAHGIGNSVSGLGQTHTNCGVKKCYICMLHEKMLHLYCQWC